MARHVWSFVNGLMPDWLVGVEADAIVAVVFVEPEDMLVMERAAASAGRATNATMSSMAVDNESLATSFAASRNGRLEDCTSSEAVECQYAFMRRYEE